MRKILFVISLLIVASLILTACGGAAATAQPQTAAATSAVATEAPSASAAPTSTTGASSDATATTATGAATTAPSTTSVPVAGGERLAAVLARGKLICGVHGSFQGFGFVDSAGKWTGFDVDFCRAWAAALFNNADAVEFRGLSAQARFTALQSGEVDVLSRNSTWTLTRDAELGLTFGPVTFYDGQAIMAKKDIAPDASAGLKALEGANVCVQSGTTTGV